MDNTKLWDVTSSHFVTGLRGNLGSVFDVALSPNGNLLVAGYGDTRSGIRDMGGIIVWNLLSGKEIYHRDKRNGNPTDTVFSVTFNPDGKLIAAGIGPRSSKTVGRVQVFNAASGKEVFHLEVGSGATYGVGFSPNGELLAATTRSVTKVWRLSDQKEIMQLPGGTDVKFSPCGVRLAICDSGVWEIAAEKLSNVCKFRGNRFDFSPDGRRLAVATGRPAGVRVLGLTGDKTQLLEFSCPGDWNVYDVAFTP